MPGFVGSLKALPPLEHEDVLGASQFLIRIQYTLLLAIIVKTFNFSYKRITDIKVIGNKSQHIHNCWLKASIWHSDIYVGKQPLKSQMFSVFMGLNNDTCIYDGYVSIYDMLEFSF